MGAKREETQAPRLTILFTARTVRLTGKSGCKRNESNQLVPDCDSVGGAVGPEDSRVCSNSETAVACSARSVRVSRLPNTRDRATRKMQTISNAYGATCSASGNLTENRDSC